MESVAKLRDEKGLSAAVYTQLTDVETECNGLMTYDRAVTEGRRRTVACRVWRIQLKNVGDTLSGLNDADECRIREATNSVNAIRSCFGLRHRFDIRQATFPCVYGCRHGALQPSVNRSASFGPHEPGA